MKNLEYQQRAVTELIDKTIPSVKCRRTAQ